MDSSCRLLSDDNDDDEPPTPIPPVVVLLRRIAGQLGRSAVGFLVEGERGDVDVDGAPIPLCVDERRVFRHSALHWTAEATQARDRAYRRFAGLGLTMQELAESKLAEAFTRMCALYYYVVAETKDVALDIRNYATRKRIRRAVVDDAPHVPCYANGAFDARVPSGLIRRANRFLLPH